MHGHLVLDYLSASGKAKSETVDHIHRVIPKSLPVRCKMATAYNSDIPVNDTTCTLPPTSNWSLLKLNFSDPKRMKLK